MAHRPGKEYEEIVAAIHREFGRDATVQEDVKVTGKSGKERQIDILIDGEVNVFPIRVIVDAKGLWTQSRDSEGR